MELTEKELSFFTIFERITQVMPTDFAESGGIVVFVVEPQSLGKAIGKGGANIQRLKKQLKKKVLIVADSKELETFVRNFFSSISVLAVEQRDAMGEKAIIVTLNEKDRGLAIGKEGERIKALKQLLKKRFNATVHLRTKRVLAEVAEPG